MTAMNADVLAKENVRLYEENLKLRLLLGKTENESTKVANKKNVKKTTETNATRNNTKKNNVNNNNTNNVETKTKRKYTRKTNVQNANNNSSETQNNSNLSEFQQQLVNKKMLAFQKYTENTSISDIAKELGQGESTIRNYIREMKGMNAPSK